MFGKSNAFDMQKYVYYKSVFNTLYIEINHKFKKISLRQNKRYKNALFFLSRAPSHRSFTFNLRFLCELKHKIDLSKTMTGIFHFWFCFHFIKVYVFIQPNA